VKITPRFTLVLVLYAAALFIGVGLFAYNSGRESLRSATISELQATALEKEAALNQWVEDKQADITALAADPIVIQSAATLLTADRDSLEFREAYESFISSAQPRLISGEFLEVSLLHPETGQVIASTTPSEEGKFKEDRPYFLNGKSSSFVQNPYYSVAMQGIAMTAAAPLKSSDSAFLAVVTAQLDLVEMNEIISRRTAIHETDDAYLVNTSNLFATQPRFLRDPAVLQRGIHTEDVKLCLQKQSGVIETPDYQNEPAIVVYRWLPERNLCLVVNLDETEAYQSIRAFGWTIAAGSMVALLAAVILAIALARSLTRPILAIQEGAARFARGDLDTRLDETSQDELGQLAVEFNKMAQALVEQQTTIRRRAEQFFNLGPDLFCTLNATGRLLDLNPAWNQSLGYNPEELSGESLMSTVHPEDVPATQAALTKIVREGTGRFESRFRHKDGHYRWLAWVVVTSPQDELLYAAARDITDRRLDEERLRQQAEELERSNRDLEEIAHVASHDLQEPLRLVSTNVQFLSRRYLGRLDQDADEFIGFTLEGTNRMKSLLADLLAYTSISTSLRDYASVDMEAVVTQVLENLQKEIQNNRAIVTHDPLPAVLGDAAQLMLLVQSILDNAIKFRGKDPPRVHMGVSQVTDRWLFYVRDNGIGIDPRYTERVFVIFQRLHSRDDSPGTGAGLAISRKIVERHGGRIWVDSEPGKGATFYFTLEPVEGSEGESQQRERVTPESRETVVDRARDLI
jgi:PAS domain S-box-containing protein